MGKIYNLINRIESQRARERFEDPKFRDQALDEVISSRDANSYFKIITMTGELTEYSSVELELLERYKADKLAAKLWQKGAKDDYKKVASN